MLNTTNTTTKTAASILASGILAVTGCAFVDNSDTDLARDEQGLIIPNLIIPNLIIPNLIIPNGAEVDGVHTFNGFHFNPNLEFGLNVHGDALDAHSLDGLVINSNGNNGITVNGQSFSVEQEASFRVLISYLAQCALAPEQSITLKTSSGTNEVLSGALGLATEWRNGPLSETGKRYVSACLAARSNANGQRVNISLRASNIQIDATERTTFTAIEGAFWGNAFGDAPAIHTCTADADPIGGRRCTGEDCGFHSVGACSTVCTQQDATSGSFGDCSGEIAVITTALPQTHDTAFSTGHSCVVENDGTLNCWGENASGQVGDGSNITRALPTDVALGSTVPVAEVAGGTAHSCARQRNGSVTCWGDNTYGQLGDGSDAASANNPALVDSLISHAMSLRSGADHICALEADGAVVCWGKNSDGQLGNSSTTDSNVPAVVELDGDAISLVTSSTADHTCAILVTGDIYCWGNNNNGQLGDNTTIDRSVPVLAQQASNGLIDACTGTSFTCTLNLDGVVDCFGSMNVSQTQAAASIECSATSVCATLADGTDVCW